MPTLATYALPFPPSFNHAWRSVARGRVLLSKAARQYRVAVSNALPSGRVVPLACRLSVSVTLVPPVKQRGEWDVDNRLKALFDALTHARVWLDDKQIDQILAERQDANPAVPGGYALVAISHITPTMS